MSTWRQDLRGALRMLWRQPLLSAIVVLTLALAIGANSAIYSVLHHTLLSPPPYRDPDRLVAVWGVLPSRDIDEWPASPSLVEIYRQETTLFEGFAGLFGGAPVLQMPGGEPRQVTLVGLTWNAFGLLGVHPALGRDFDAADGRFNPDEVPPGIPPPNNVFNPFNAVILSYDFWQTAFGGDPGVLGRRVDLDEEPATVVGVMPRGFQLLMHGAVPARPDVFAAMRTDTMNTPLTNVFLTVVGRMKEGVSLGQAQEEMTALSVRLRQREPLYETGGWSNRLIPLRDELTRDIRQVVLMLGAAVALVLLIACANVANLMLVRAAGQARDTEIRAALGCGRWRQLQRSLLETGVLVAVSTLLGLALAAAFLPLLVALQPANLPQLDAAGIDRAVLAFSIAVTLIVTLVAGALPAQAVARQNLALHTKARGAGGSERWRDALVVGEVALAFTAVVVAGLMVRSFHDLTARDPGFEPRGVLTFSYGLPNARYPRPDEVLGFHRELHGRLAALPGVESAGAILPLPLSGVVFGSRYAPELASFLDGSARQAQYRRVWPGYFEAVRARIVAGRTFTAADNHHARPYVVVDEPLARRTWPGKSALGQRLYIRGATPDPVELEVIGVVRHQAQGALDEEPAETLYIAQGFASTIGFFGNLFWTVRSAADPLALVGPIQHELAQMDAQVPMINVRTLDDLVEESAAPMRFAMTLFGIFGTLALLLATVGLYGVVAYRVRLRRRELAVRMSLGAPRAEVFRLVVGQGFLLVGVGLAAGIGMALFAGPLLTGLLVGVAPYDPRTYGAIVALFVAVAVLASALPARRAARIDPMEALRHE